MNPTRFIVCLALIASSACSARGGNGNYVPPDDASSSSDTPPSSNDTPASSNDMPAVPGDTCTRVCANVTMSPGCSSDPTECMTQCSNLVSLGSASCRAQVNAFASCAVASPVTCSDMTANFTACAAQQAALISCVGSSTPRDASVPVDAMTSVDASVAETCAALCTRLDSMPACEAARSNCAAQCGSLSALPPSCIAPVGAFFACARTAPFTCSGTTFNVPSCMTLLNAVTACLGGGTPDAGVRDSGGGDPCTGFTNCGSCTGGPTCGWCGGRCYNGSSTGPNPPNTCGGQAWAWVSSQCP